MLECLTLVSCKPNIAIAAYLDSTARDFLNTIFLMVRKIVLAYIDIYECFSNC